VRLLDSLWRLALRLAYRLLLAWWFVRRPAIHGSHVAVWHGERLLVIQNSYRKLLSLPAGGRARGETLRDAAVRELREEVGVQVHPDELAYYGELVHQTGYAEDHAHVFELRCDTEPEVRIDRREVVWAGFLAPEEALARGVVGVLRLYLENHPMRAAATAASNDAPSRIIRR
jgi:8-oxo-dGTP pyrophosphatase MutT (NUDIX family)